MSLKKDNVLKATQSISRSIRSFSKVTESYDKLESEVCSFALHFASSILCFVQLSAKMDASLHDAINRLSTDHEHVLSAYRQREQELTAQVQMARDLLTQAQQKYQAEQQRLLNTTTSEGAVSVVSSGPSSFH